MTEPYRLGMLVQTARKRRGLTLIELATQIDIDASTLSRIETGERIPRDPVLLALARALALSVDDVWIASDRLPEDLLQWILTTPGIVQRLRKEKEMCV